MFKDLEQMVNALAFAFGVSSIHRYTSLGLNGTYLKSQIINHCNRFFTTAYQVLPDIETSQSALHS